MDITRIIGCRYFKAKTKEDDSVEVEELFKVVGLQNETTLKVKDLLHGGDNIKVDKKAFEDEYILLEPDAYIMFSIVYLQDSIEDIIVSMFKTKDMSQGVSVPYCVCRQNITNLHGAMIRTQDLNNFDSKEVGMCMSIETIPDGIDYNIMTSCNGVKHFTMVATYIDDKLNDILSCVKINKFNNVLEELFQEHMRHVIIDREKASKDPIHMGYCRSLESLLEYNSFMYDFRRAFGIADIKINLNCEITDEGKLTNYAKNFLQKEYNKYILDELVIKFEKDIDIDSIKQNKIMVCDNNQDIYIIICTEGNKFIEDAIHSGTKMNPSEKLEAIFSSNLSASKPTKKTSIPKSFI